MKHEIKVIPEKDRPELLALQKLCYRREAELYNDFNIPPMTQTLEALSSEFDEGTEALGLYLNGQLVGSARGYKKEETVFIGRVIVHPDHWKKGWGQIILEALEKHFPETKQAELFTGSKSLANVRFYSKCGYEIFKTGLMGENITLLYFRKKLT